MFLLLTLVWAMLIAGMLWRASSALHAATLQRRVEMPTPSTSSARSAW